MKCTAVFDCTASPMEMQVYPTDSEQITVRLRLLLTTRDSVKEYATFSGLNFTSLVRHHFIKKLTTSYSRN